MGSEDIDDLWKTVEELRAAQSTILVSLGRIEAMLSERCDIRAKALSGLEARVRGVEKRIWWASGVAATVAFVGGIVARLR